MKWLVIMFAVMNTTGIFAETPQISVNVNGVTYFCGLGNNNNGTSISCVKEVTDYCYQKTSNGSNQCYSIATSACKGSGENFPSCVRETTDYCYQKTSLGASQCFNNSLESCKGNVRALKQMVDAVGAK